MMGVYIKGMEMPNRCWDCDLCYDKFYCKSLDMCLLGEQDKKYRPKEYDPADDRLPNCPLVPVPPHGRLGDLDALKVSLAFAEKTAEWAVPALRAVLMVIDEMPTVISADPAEEGET